jgi:hypothetical protein
MTVGERGPYRRAPTAADPRPIRSVIRLARLRVEAKKSETRPSVIAAMALLIGLSSLAKRSTANAERERPGVP